MAEYLLKNNYFQFSDKVYQQISATTIGTKFATSYVYILWIKWKVSSSKLKSFNLLYGLGTLMIFFSSGLMVKTVSKTWWWYLITLILISSLLISELDICTLIFFSSGLIVKTVPKIWWWNLISRKQSQ